MKISDAQLLAILKIGHEVSCRGAGLSLRDAIARARYVELRPCFGPSDLLPLVKSHPEVIEEWIRYSEDKRTSSGWGVSESGVVAGSERLTFESLEEAVAEFVVRELDFWVQIGDGRGSL